MPESRFYICNSVQVVNNCIYIIGGRVSTNPGGTEDDSTRGDCALWAAVQADGSLSEWKRSAPYPGNPVSNAATCSREKHIFLVGGNCDTISNLVSVADLAPDGTPMQWRQVGTLPTALWFHGAAILEDRLYVWGGLVGPNDTAANKLVYVAPLAADGTVGQWQQHAPMPSGVYASAFCGFNDYLVCIAGRYDKGLSNNDIWFTRLRDGRVERWQMVKTDIEKRMYHSVALDKLRGWALVNGGQLRTGLDPKEPFTLQDAVQAFRLPQPEESRLKMAGTTQAQTQGLPEFRSLENAFALAKNPPKQIFVFFYSPEVPAAKRVWDSVINTPAFREKTQGFVLASVDISTKGSAYSYKYNLFKVPSMAILAPDGSLVRSTMQLKDNADLLNFLNVR